MFFDYGLLGSYLFSALVIYINEILLKWADTNRALPDQNKKAVKNKTGIFRIFCILLSLIIILRLLFLFSFPTETILAGIDLKITKWYVFWLVSQFLLAAVYTFFLMLSILYYRIKETVRYQYLAKRLRTIRIILYMDIFIVFGSYFYFSYFFLIPTTDVQQFSWNIKPLPGIVSAVAASASLILFSVIYLLYKNKRNLFYQNIYGVVFILTLLLNVYISLAQMDSYFQVFSWLEFLSVMNGFYGWLWILLVLMSILSFVLVVLIQRLKEGFINIQFYLNVLVYSLQFNFITTSGLVVLAILPIFLKLMYSLV